LFSFDLEAIEPENIYSYLPFYANNTALYSPRSEDITTASSSLIESQLPALAKSLTNGKPNTAQAGSTSAVVFVL